MAFDEISDPTNFVISFTRQPRDDFGVFAKGYALAANRLAEALIQAPRFSDYEAYPVVFLYRHALELSLKHIICGGLKLVALRGMDEMREKLQHHHDLEKLFTSAGNILSV